MMLVLLLLLLITSPAYAQPADCARQQRFPDHLICANAGLRTADAQMTRAFAALRSRLAARGRQRLVEFQRAWLSARNGLCGYGQEESATVSCLLAITAARAAELARGESASRHVRSLAAIEGQPGWRIEAAIWTRSLARSRCNIVIRHPTLIGHPARARFNAESRRMTLGNEPPACPTERATDPHERAETDVTFVTTWASARIIAVIFRFYEDAGGAHPNTARAALIFDLAENRRLAVTDIVDQAALPLMAAECRRQIAAALRARGSEPLNLEQGVDQAVRQIDHWAFEPGAVRLMLNPNAVASYADGPLDCVISAAILQPHLAANSPLR